MNPKDLIYGKWKLPKSSPKRSFNPLLQALALWGPAVIGLVGAVLLVIFDVPDLTTGDLRRLASLCASLLIAGLAGTGIVAALGLGSKKATVETQGANDPAIMKKSQIGAGVGILVSLLLTCAAIVTGGLATPSSLANFICISGLLAAVLQIFAGPISLAVARLGHKPFLLDELAI